MIFSHSFCSGLNEISIQEAIAENGKQYDQDITNISAFKSVFSLKQVVFSSS